MSLQLRNVVTKLGITFASSFDKEPEHPIRVRWMTFVSFKDSKSNEEKRKVQCNFLKF